MINTIDVARTYRRLLKQINCFCPNSRVQWKDRIGSLFRRAGSSVGHRQQLLLYNQLLQAKESISLMESLQTQKQLFEQYRIGTFTNQREKLRRAAARVGLKMPDFADERDETMEEIQERLGELKLPDYVSINETTADSAKHHSASS